MFIIFYLCIPCLPHFTTFFFFTLKGRKLYSYTQKEVDFNQINNEGEKYLSYN